MKNDQHLYPKLSLLIYKTSTQKSERSALLVRVFLLEFSYVVLKKMHKKVNSYLIFPNSKALRENCPSKELFPDRIFLYLDWIQKNTDRKKTPYLDNFHAVTFMIYLCEFSWSFRGRRKLQFLRPSTLLKKVSRTDIFWNLVSRFFQNP